MWFKKDKRLSQKTRQLDLNKGSRLKTSIVYMSLIQFEHRNFEYVSQKPVIVIWPRICSTCRKHFPVLSSFMTYHRVVTRLARSVPLVEQELLTLQEHLSSPPVFSGVRVTRSLVCCVIFCRSLFGLSFHLRILIAPFGIFKLLLDYMCMDIYTRVTVHNW